MCEPVPHGRQGWIGAFPAGKDVAHGVRANSKPRLAAPVFHEATRGEVRLGEQHPRHHRGRGFGDGGEFVDLAVNGRPVQEKTRRKMSAHRKEAASPGAINAGILIGSSEKSKA